MSLVVTGKRWKETDGRKQQKVDRTEEKKQRIIRLSKRLKQVADFVPEGSRIADIGTDHGYIPIYLCQTGRAASALAMDVRKGPLCRAREHIKEYEDSFPGCFPQVRLSDGLKELKEGEADTVIIAGMGGELEIKIMEEGRRLWSSIKTWVLSPQSDLDKVRRFLAENGFCIEAEAMLKDEGKFYTVMRAVRGQMEYKSQAEYLYGKKLLEAGDKILEEYLLCEQHRVEKILSSLKREDEKGEKREMTPAMEAAFTQLEEELSWIKEAQNGMQ